MEKSTLFFPCEKALWEFQKVAHVHKFEIYLRQRRLVAELSAVQLHLAFSQYKAVRKERSKKSLSTFFYLPSLRRAYLRLMQQQYRTKPALYITVRSVQHIFSRMFFSLLSS